MHEVACEEAVSAFDATGRMVVWSPSAQRLFGWSRTEIEKSNSGVFCGHCLGLLRMTPAAIKAVNAHGGYRNDRWLRHRDGTRFRARITVRRTTLRGVMIGHVITVRDISEEHRASRALRERVGQLQAIIETLPDGVIIANHSGRIEAFSAGADRMFGWSEAEIVGQNIASLLSAPATAAISGEVSELLRKSRDENQAVVRQMIARHRNGSTFPVEVMAGRAMTGYRKHLVTFVRDITARQAADAKLQDAQDKLSRVSRANAMGTLATALAHELNQPLMAITAYLQTSSAMLERQGHVRVPEVIEALDQAASQAIRAGQIIHRLRNFLGRGEIERSVEQIETLLHESVGLAMMGIADNNIALHLDLACAGQQVLADRIQVQQVLVNLLRNAAEALSQQGGGTIRMRARVEGPMIKVTVEDDGPGLGDVDPAQIFNPFVTTKANGLGLGLSICKSIIEAHGGQLSAAPGVAKGAAFSFSLPRLEEGPNEY